MKTLTFETREEWLAGRRGLIGASDAYAILGCGYRNQSAFTIWQNKATGTTLPVTKEEQERFDRGHICEGFALQLFAHDTGLEVVQEDNIIHVSDETDYIGCSLDGVVVDAAEPVEAKMVGNWQMNEWRDDQTPLRFEIQMQQQLYVLGVEVGHLAGLNGDNLMRRTVYRNDQFIRVMLKVLKRFWDSVLAGEPPEIDATWATKSMLKALYPDDFGGVVRLPREAGRWCVAREYLRDLKKQVDAGIDLCENQIKAAMGANSFGVGPNGIYSWRKQYREGYTVQPGSFRVLRKVKSLPVGIEPPTEPPNERLESNGKDEREE